MAIEDILTKYKLPPLPKLPLLGEKPKGILELLQPERPTAMTTPATLPQKTPYELPKVVKLIEGQPLFEEPITGPKIKPLVTFPTGFAGNPESKIDFFKNVVLGLPEAALKTLPFTKLLVEPTPATFSGRLKAVGNEAYDFIRGIATLVARPGISTVSLLKNEPIETQIKNIPFLGQVPTYERSAYEGLMLGLSVPEVGISLAAEAAITASIIIPGALKTVQELKPAITTKTIKVDLTRQDIQNITAGGTVPENTLIAFKNATGEGIDIGSILRKGESIRVKIQTPNVIGEVLYRPVGKGLFEKVIYYAKETKPIPIERGLAGYAPIYKRPFAPIGATIEPMKPVGKAIEKAIPPELQSFVKEKAKIIPINQAIQKFEQTGTADIIIGEKYRVGIKDEGEAGIQVIIGPKELTEIGKGIKLIRSLSTKEEAFAFAKQIQDFYNLAKQAEVRPAPLLESAQEAISKGISKEEWIKGQKGTARQQFSAPPKEKNITPAIEQYTKDLAVASAKEAGITKPIEEIYIVGSRAKGTSRVDSDVDFVVKFKGGLTPDEFTAMDDASARILNRLNRYGFQNAQFSGESVLKTELGIGKKIFDKSQLSSLYDEAVKGVKEVKPEITKPAKSWPNPRS